MDPKIISQNLNGEKKKLTVVLPVKEVPKKPTKDKTTKNNKQLKIFLKEPFEREIKKTIKNGKIK